LRDMMRSRRRYIAFEVAGAKVSEGDIYKALNRLSHELPGSAIDLGLLKLITFEVSSQRGLMRCGHKQVGQVKGAMAGIRKFGGKRAALKILGVSGTIRGARRKFLAARAKS